MSSLATSSGHESRDYSNSAGSLTETFEELNGGPYHNIAEAVLNRPTRKRKSKIICTMGPSCWDEEKVGKLIDAGMNIARLNFSHGDHESHLRTLRTIVKVRTKKKVNVAIMLDTKGPEIRTGFNEGDGKVTFKQGSKITVTTDYSVKCNSTTLACTYKGLPTSVEPGQEILVADGSLVLTVLSLGTNSVTCEVMNDATIGSRKNMNLPGVIVDLPVVTEKDRNDLVEFACRQPIDFIAASFVRRGSDLDEIRNVLGPRGRQIKIISKIENQEGLANYDAILAKSDGIMVARGDLGMEIPPEKVFLAQKLMIRKANLAGKPVVTATQMLESMIVNPRPTRAECTDVANAILDGSDCVMLSGETASGNFPIKSATMMAHVCVQAESSLRYGQLYQDLRRGTMNIFGKMTTPEAITSSAVKTAMDMRADAIIVLTDSGNTARLVAKYRPVQPILVLTANAVVANQTNGWLRSVHAKCIGSMIGTDSILQRAIEMCKELKWVKSGSCVVAVHGMLEARSGATNMLKVLTVK
eukprot:g1175.t1